MRGDAACLRLASSHPLPTQSRKTARWPPGSRWTDRQRKACPGLCPAFWGSGWAGSGFSHHFPVFYVVFISQEVPLGPQGHHTAGDSRKRTAPRCGENTGLCRELGEWVRLILLTLKERRYSEGQESNDQISQVELEWLHLSSLPRLDLPGPHAWVEPWKPGRVQFRMGISTAGSGPSSHVLLSFSSQTCPCGEPVWNRLLWHGVFMAETLLKSSPET